MLLMTTCFVVNIGPFAMIARKLLILCMINKIIAIVPMIKKIKGMPKDAPGHVLHGALLTT